MYTIAAPAAQNITPTPEAVDTTKFFAEFAADTAQAAEHYKNRRFFITNVKVESVTRSGLVYFINVGKLRFSPKYLYYLDNITQDTVVNIVGQYSTSVGFAIYFKDCWFEVVSGGLLTPTRSNY